MKQWKSRVPRKRRNEGFVALTNIINGGLSAVSWTLKVAEKEAKKAEAKKKVSSSKNTTKSAGSYKSTHCPTDPYKLGKNDLTQGEYVIGKDIPAGVYDFFVVYGNGGKFDIAKYDENDKIVDGTWTFYWVGLQQSYEKKELIHIDCKEGYTVKISGNIVLKIVKSQTVRIEL